MEVTCRFPYAPVRYEESLVILTSLTRNTDIPETDLR